MAGATALFSDGLDLLAEFLASSHAVDDGIAVVYEQPVRWHAAATELARWSGVALGSASGIVLDQAALRITVTPALWNQLYARALSAGRSVAPDRTGMATRGAGGMLAELSRLPAMAGAVLHIGPELVTDDADAEPWLLLPWEPLKALLLRDRLLVQEAMRPRPLQYTLPASVARFDAAVQRHGLLLQQKDQPMQLYCPRAWSERIGGELRCHFTESVLLLFRLMFHCDGQGWGWDADSAQCAGLVALMDDAERSGLAGFGVFRDSCALLARAIGHGDGGGHRHGADAGPSRAMLMAAAVRQLAALWPADYLQAGHPSCSLMAGWMTRVHLDASIAPDALLGPGVSVGRDCVIGAGAVLLNGAEIGPFQVVPPGVVIAAGALVARIALFGNTLPPGTVLRGNLVVFRKASIGSQVTLGADAEIGFDIAIPDGVQVADGAVIHTLRLGAGVMLPAGTVIEGNLIVEEDVEFGSGIRTGANVLIQHGAAIGDGVCLPPNVVVASGACIQRCTLGRGAELGSGAIIHGDLTLGPLAEVGAGVKLGANAVIDAGVVVPAGVTVQAGAHIAALKLHGCWLPPGTVLGGDLRLGRHCEVGSGVVFEGDNRIASHIDLPNDLRIARGARIHHLHLAGAVLAPGIVVCGNAFVASGTRIGRGVRLEADVVVTAAALPDGVTVMRRAYVGRCDVAGTLMRPGTRIGGDIVLAPGVQVGWNVRLHKGVRINAVCRIPDGVEIMPAAVVDWFQVAPHVVLPPGTRVAGNLCLKRGVVVGAGVSFGAGAVVDYDVMIPNGAHLARGAVISRLDIAPDVGLPDRFTLYGNAVLGAGSSVGERVVLGADVEVGAGVALPPGVTLIEGVCIGALRIADDVVLPIGTRLGGDVVLRRGVRVGLDVELGAGTDIGPHLCLPNGIVVACGAIVRVLSVAAGVLPGHGVCIEGDLSAGPGARVAPGVRFGAGVVLEAGCRVGSGIVLPPGVIVNRHARLNCIDIAADVLLPPQTRIGGDLRIATGVQVGRQVCFGQGVCIGPGVAIPAGICLADHATVNRLELVADAVLGARLTVCGDVAIGAGVRIGDDVMLGAGAVVGAGVHLPNGVVVALNATVDVLRLGADVRLPEEFGIAGDLCLEDRVVVGARVQFGAGVVVGAGVVIGDGAVLGDNVVVCAGAVIGENVCLAADTVVDAGACISSGEHVDGARPSDSAHFSLWQAYLSGAAAPATAPPMPVAAAMPPSSAPVDVPPPNVLQPWRGNQALPRPAPFT